MKIIGICNKCGKKLVEGKSKLKNKCDYCNARFKDVTNLNYKVVFIKRGKESEQYFNRKDFAESFKELKEKKGFICRLVRVKL